MGKTKGLYDLIYFGLGALLLLGSVTGGFAQELPKPTRLWSVGPLTKSEPVMGITFGPGGATTTGPHVDTQTSSIFAATRSVVFAGDRIVIASKIGMRRIGGAQNPAEIYHLISLDTQTGQVKDTREIPAFGSLKVFAANDAHVIVAGHSVMRLTPDLKDAGSFDYDARGHKFGSVENISPDGSTLANATSPGLELIDADTLKAETFTDQPILPTSVSSKAVVSDSPWWIKDYPKEKSFVTLTDEKGQHLIFHGDCGGRPVFLRDDRVLTASCKIARILDIQGNILKTITLHDPVSFAGVSQNGKRFALQVASFSDTYSIKHERFVVYSVDTGEPVAEVMPEKPGEEQSWTALSPDGSMIVVGSPLKLTLYRLP
jgi:WD40 repeat protein